MRDHLYLIHYASPYYDPVYAHEYYEAHKKLKGRRSTAGLTEEGRIVAQNVKSNIDAAKKRDLDSARETNKSDSDRLNSIYKARRDAQSRKSQQEITSQKDRMSREIKSHVNVANQRIEALADQLSKIGKDDPDRNANILRVKREISSLREENSKKRDSLNKAYQEWSSKHSESNKKSQEDLSASHRIDKKTLSDTYKSKTKDIRDKYDSEYENELEKIRSEYSRPAKKAKPKSSSSPNTQKRSEPSSAPPVSSASSTKPSSKKKKKISGTIQYVKGKNLFER